MKAFSVRNIPDHVYIGLQDIAKRNRRSLQEQIKLILEKEVELGNMSFLAGAERWRNRFLQRTLSDAVSAVREDRER